MICSDIFSLDHFPFCNPEGITLGCLRHQHKHQKGACFCHTWCTRNPGNSNNYCDWAQHCFQMADFNFFNTTCEWSEANQYRLVQDNHSPSLIPSLQLPFLSTTVLLSLVRFPCQEAHGFSSSTQMAAYDRLCFLTFEWHVLGIVSICLYQVASLFF